MIKYKYFWTKYGLIFTSILGPLGPGPGPMGPWDRDHGTGTMGPLGPGPMGPWDRDLWDHGTGTKPGPGPGPSRDRDQAGPGPKPGPGPNRAQDQAGPGHIIYTDL